MKTNTIFNNHFIYWVNANHIFKQALVLSIPAAKRALKFKIISNKHKSSHHLTTVHLYE